MNKIATLFHPKIYGGTMLLTLNSRNIEIGLKMISVTTQNVDTWKKRIQKSTLKGSTYFTQEGGVVNVSASADHQAVCKRVLGSPNRTHSLASYVSWGDVKAQTLLSFFTKSINNGYIYTHK